MPPCWPSVIRETAVQVEGDKIVVDGRLEDLETVARTIAAAGRGEGKTPAAGKKAPPPNRSTNCRWNIPSTNCCRSWETARFRAMC